MSPDEVRRKRRGGEGEGRGGGGGGKGRERGWRKRREGWMRREDGRWGRKKLTCFFPQDRTAVHQCLLGLELPNLVDSGEADSEKLRHVSTR